MDQKKYGTLMLTAGIFITFISIAVKINNDVLNRCIDCGYVSYTIVWFIAGFLVVIGLLFMRSDDLEKTIAESRLKLNEELRSAKKKEREKEEFQMFLDGFDAKEKEVIELLHTFEGITQKALEKKTTIEKNRLKRILRDLKNTKTISILDSKIYLLKLSR